VLVCDASSASRSEVIFGALHHGAGVTLAVFTDGRDPSLARNTRDRIATLREEWEEK
jgi:siroheme synthase (precorrin-2 oxidase/ferrochelatase)